jgi:hypothetical protein
MEQVEEWHHVDANHSVTVYVYVQTGVGNFAYRLRGALAEQCNAIKGGLQREQVEALFEG